MAAERNEGWHIILADPFRGIFSLSVQDGALEPLYLRPRNMPSSYVLSMASLSPDGTKLAFTEGDSGGSVALVVFDLTTKRRLVLLNSPHLDGARWSPDGEDIAYQGTNSAGKDYAIYRLRLSDKHLSKIADDVQYGDSLFWWAPDGKSVVYQTRSDEIDVVVLGTTQRRSVGYGYHPTWSPNGKYISYWMSEDAGYAICDSDTGRVVFTLKGNFPTGALMWSPDSRYVAYMGLDTGFVARLLIHLAGEGYHGNVYVTDLHDNVTEKIYAYPGSLFSAGWGAINRPH